MNSGIIFIALLIIVPFSNQYPAKETQPPDLEPPDEGSNPIYDDLDPGQIQPLLPSQLDPQEQPMDFQPPEEIQSPEYRPVDEGPKRGPSEAPQEFADEVQPQSGASPLPKFTPKPRPPSTTTRAPALIEQDTPPTRPPFAGLLRIPKFDMPAPNAINNFKPNSGVWISPPRGPLRDQFREQLRNSDAAWRNKASVKHVSSGRGNVKAVHVAPTKSSKLVFDLQGGKNSEPFSDLNKMLMVYIAFYAAFAALLVIFLLTFLLMDRIVCLA